MKLITFTLDDGSSLSIKPIEILHFVQFKNDISKTVIFVLSPSKIRKYIVRENFRQVVKMLENL